MARKTKQTAGVTAKTPVTAGNLLALLTLALKELQDELAARRGFDAVVERVMKEHPEVSEWIGEVQSER